MAHKHELKPQKTELLPEAETEDKGMRHNQSNVVCAVQCGKERSLLYVGETKLHKRVA